MTRLGMGSNFPYTADEGHGKSRGSLYIHTNCPTTLFRPDSNSLLRTLSFSSVRSTYSSNVSLLFFIFRFDPLSPETCFSIMALSLNPRDKSTGITFGIYKPASGYDIDDAVRHIRAAIASAEQTGSVRAAILSSVNGSWVAVFCAWRGTAPSVYDLSDEATGVIRKVDCGCFQVISSERKEASFARLSVGNIVSVRRIYTEMNTQEVFAYSCLAVMKAYFAQTKGALSCTFYKSEDGTLIIGLSTWDSAGSASAFMESCGSSPGEAYWRDLDAKKLKFEVCRVVYITREKAAA